MSDLEVLREYGTLHHPGSRVPLAHPVAVLKTPGPDSKILSSNLFSREKGRASPHPSNPVAPESGGIMIL